MSNADKLEQIEKRLGWIEDWMRFFICQFYEVDNMSQVSEAQRLLTESDSPLPKPPRWVV